jgi:hypothetical protein
MLWVKIFIIVASIAVIIISIPKLKSKYQASSPETQEKIALYIPLFLAIVGAAILISVVR